MLGAIAAALACGASLADASEALPSVAAYRARMEPKILPSGAVMLRDDYNGSIDSFDAAIEVLRQARARRRILIITDCSDCKRSPRDRLKYFVKQARDCAEVIVFVSERAERGREYAIRSGMAPQNVHAFLEFQEAADFLRTDLRAGDLALLRGRMTDHITRLYFALLGDVACRKVTCSRHSCDSCPNLGFRPFDVSAPQSQCVA